MATPELEQVMWEAEVRRLDQRGRLTERERYALSSRATREGIDDSILWMEPVLEKPAAGSRRCRPVRMLRSLPFSTR